MGKAIRASLGVVLLIVMAYLAVAFTGKELYESNMDVLSVAGFLYAIFLIGTQLVGRAKHDQEMSFAAIFSGAEGITGIALLLMSAVVGGLSRIESWNSLSNLLK